MMQDVDELSDDEEQQLVKEPPLKRQRPRAHHELVPVEALSDDEPASSSTAPPPRLKGQGKGGVEARPPAKVPSLHAVRKAVALLTRKKCRCCRHKKSGSCFFQFRDDVERLAGLQHNLRSLAKSDSDREVSWQQQTFNLV